MALPGAKLAAHDPKKAMQEQVFLGINMGETEEITVECSPAGSLQLIDRFGGYDFLFVSFSPKKGSAGIFPAEPPFCNNSAGIQHC